MVRSLLRWAGPCLAACVLSSPAAHAQNSATAAALFDKGVADMQAGRHQAACPAIEESQRLDPRPGTLFTLAECHARSSKVASAVAEYQEYLDVVSRLTDEQRQRHEQRADIARAQITKLKPSVPMLTLNLPERAPSGTFVTRNGVALKGAALGLALPVDPGDYAIVTHVPGAPEREAHVSLGLGETKTLTLEVPEPTPSRPSDSASATGHESAQPQQLAAKPAASSNRSAAYLTGGVGVAGILVGSVTGILVLSKKGTVADNCRDHDCNETGLSAADSAKKLALVSDVGFGVGLAAVAVSAVLLLTSHDENPPAKAKWQPVVVAAPGVAAAGLSRRF